jgi:hypothetical protein
MDYNKENRDWFAAVKYKDRDTECVKVKYVKDFCPTGLTDFDPTLVFKIETKTWSKSLVAEPDGQTF